MSAFPFSRLGSEAFPPSFPETSLEDFTPIPLDARSQPGSSSDRSGLGAFSESSLAPASQGAGSFAHASTPSLSLEQFNQVAWFFDPFSFMPDLMGMVPRFTVPQQAATASDTRSSPKPDHLCLSAKGADLPEAPPYLQKLLSGKINELLQKDPHGRIYLHRATQLSLGEPAFPRINWIDMTVPKRSLDALINRHNIGVARAKGKISITYICPDLLLCPFVQLVQLIDNLKKDWSGTITLNFIDPNYKVGIENDLRDKEQVLLMQSVVSFHMELYKILPKNIHVNIVLFSNYADYVAKGEKFDSLVIADVPLEKFKDRADIPKGRKDEESLIAELSMVPQKGVLYPTITVSCRGNNLTRVFKPKTDSRPGSDKRMVPIDSPCISPSIPSVSPVPLFSRSRSTTPQAFKPQLAPKMVPTDSPAILPRIAAASPVPFFPQLASPEELAERDRLNIDWATGVLRKKMIESLGASSDSLNKAPTPSGPSAMLQSAKPMSVSASGPKSDTGEYALRSKTVKEVRSSQSQAKVPVASAAITQPGIPSSATLAELMVDGLRKKMVEDLAALSSSLYGHKMNTSS